MSPEPGESPFLRGNFAPWPSEDDFSNLPVIGTIPEGLNGTYFRNGPNPAFPPRHRYHWFDGDGMVHAITLHDGRASYRNRYVATEGLLQERRAGRALFGGLLDMRVEVPEGAAFKNTANTNIVFHAGRLLALVESGLPTEIDRSTLETLGSYDFGGKLRTAMTAHPKIDPETGAMLFFGYSAFPPYLTFHVAAADGTLERSEEVEVPWPSVIHDFAVTREHVIFTVCPLVIRPELIAATGTAFRWEPERGTRIGIAPRRDVSREIKWLATDASYVFHTMNAYQEGSTIVLDVARYGRLGFMPSREAREEEPDGDSHPRLHRWTLDLARDEVRSDPVDEAVAEFPRIDERRLGSRYRYGYMTGGSRPSDPVAVPNLLYKYNLDTGRRESHDFGAASGCGEQLFVPRSADSAEDEGYLVSLVYDGERDASDLVILDARSIAAEPLATVQLPHRVPYGFHGSWVPIDDRATR